MRNIRVAAIQMQMTRVVEENIEKAERMVREAAGQGAKIILLPELFERQYFCQERRYDYYEFAKRVEENDAVKAMSALAKELSVVLPVSIYERDGNSVFNTVVMIDADGCVMGKYRKTHIPDDHFYQEKFYFTPGDTGFKVWDTKYAKIGVGICWDQWFPECARSMALMGAEMLLYPTAIGSEPILGGDSSGHWRRTMQGHSGANLMPVIAANRIGLEQVEACEANGGQTSELSFYGSSFITDNTGEIIADGSKNKEEILIADFDLDAMDVDRLSWGIFRDRRPEMYKIISSPIGQNIVE